MTKPATLAAVKPDAIEMAAQHRARFMERLGADAALLFGAPAHHRNGDAEFRYRQSSDLLYLTAWEDPQSAVLLRPGADKPFILFVAPRDPDEEVWAGPRPGPEGAVSRFQADAAYPIGDLAKLLPDLIQGYRNLHYRFAEDFDHDRLVVGAIAKARRPARRAGLDLPDAFFDPSRLLHELRLIKTEAELSLMRRAAEITAEAHVAAMRLTRPGVMEYELEALIDHTFRRRGGAGPGYTTIVGGGANATILHYIANQDELRDGEVVCVDAGCEYGWYTADVTRAWPVNGRFSEAQAELYQLVLDVQKVAIAGCRPGNTWKAVHDEVVRGLTVGMVRLGLLPGDADDDEYIDGLIKENKFKRYYMHGTGHWLGLDVHDAGVYIIDGDARPFEPGMVSTIEPGIYVGKDDVEAPERFRGLGVRIEDDVLTTAEGVEVLTAAIPKEIAEIEAIVGRAA